MEYENEEEILRKKKEEYLKKLKEEQERLLVIKELESKLGLILEKEALERYYNIKSVNQELAMNILQYLIQLYSSGMLRKKLSDKEFKQLLEKLMPKKREPKIKFIRK